MAYSNVKRPAMYIPIFDYLNSVGQIKYQDDPLNDIHFLNPAKTHRLEPIPAQSDGTGQIQYDVELDTVLSYNTIADADGYIYLFILGHNFKALDLMLDVQLSYTGTMYDAATFDSVVNSNGSESKPDYNGFSIIKLKYSSVTLIDGFRILVRSFSGSTEQPKIGCVSLCSKWTPPHSPDLSLTMSRQYDGVKTTRTKGGATLSNAQYTRGGTFWTNGYAWELFTGEYDQTSSEIAAARTLGRRIWSMNFSYLSPENLMPNFESQNYYETENRK